MSKRGLKPVRQIPQAVLKATSELPTQQSLTSLNVHLPKNVNTPPDPIPPPPEQTSSSAKGESELSAEREELVSFKLEVRVSLDQDLAMEAAKRRTTKSALIHEGLKKMGFKVTAEDMVDSRRKSRKKTKEKRHEK